MSTSGKKQKVKNNAASQKVQTLVPPQREYPLEKLGSKKNQATKPGDSSFKK